MSGADQEHVVLELRRGRRRRAKIVISRVREGDDRYTRMCLMYPTTEADDAPLKRGSSLTFRGGDEHEQLAAIFAAITKKERATEAAAESFTAVTPAPVAAESAATPARRAQHRTIRAADPLDDEGLF